MNSYTGEHPQVLAYRRTYQGQELVVLANRRLLVIWEKNRA